MSPSNSDFTNSSGSGRYPDYIDEVKSSKNQTNNVSGFYNSEPRSPVSQNNIFGSYYNEPRSPKSNFSSTKSVMPIKEVYNPITNPVAQNIQNPYIVRDIQRGGFLPRNYLAVMADKNLLGYAR